MFCYYLFLQCCLQAAPKSSCLLTQVLSKCNRRIIHCPEVLTICIDREHMNRLTQIQRADQQASWDKLHVSRSGLGSLCPNLHPFCCLDTLLWFLSILQPPMDVHCVYPSAMGFFFFMIFIHCSTFLQKYLHVKNYGNFLRSHWETHDSHASCAKHSYFSVKQFAAFSWCSLHYFSISFTYHCINDHYMSLERKRNIFLTINF